MEGEYLDEGVEYTLTVFAGDTLVAGAVVEKLSSHSVNVALFYDTEEQVEITLDILETLWTPVQSTARLARVKQLLAEEKAKVESESKGVEGHPPAPDDLGDIPF